MFVFGEEFLFRFSLAVLMTLEKRLVKAEDMVEVKQIFEEFQSGAFDA
jgi:hypothetical protein